MTRKSIGFLFAAALCAATMSITISSCDNNSNPATPGGGRNNGGKTPQVLDGPCRGTVAVTDCPIGRASLEYVDGSLAVYGLDNPDNDGVSCSFGKPINVWDVVFDANFSESGGSLSYSAEDKDGNLEARVDLEKNGNEYAIRPTFTSTPEGGEASYQAQVIDNGQVVGTLDYIDLAQSIRIIPDCDIKFNFVNLGWRVYDVDAQCIWKLKLPPGCCRLRFVFPNGTSYYGDALNLKEQNEKGVYVYTLTDRIITRGNIPVPAAQAAYVIRAASGANTSL